MRIKQSLLTSTSRGQAPQDYNPVKKRKTMIKKEYIQPSTDVFNVEVQAVLADFSVNSGDDGIVADPDPDEDDDDNRARHTYNTWEDEED